MRSLEFSTSKQLPKKSWLSDSCHFKKSLNDNVKEVTLEAFIWGNLGVAVETQKRSSIEANVYVIFSYLMTLKTVK